MYPFRFDQGIRRSRRHSRAGASGARYIAGGTTLVDLMRETRRAARRGGRHQRAALPRHRSCSRRGYASARWCGCPSWPLIPVCGNSSQSSRRPWSSRRPPSCATWRRSVATSCSAPAACTSATSSAACNRRSPGAGCAAIGGRNRTHAILGTSDACVATHPSDLAVALVALDATVITRDDNGERAIRIAGLLPSTRHHARPGAQPAPRRVDHPRSKCRCAPSRGDRVISKVRDRESYEFAIASAAVALDISRGTVRTARLAAGGVGTVPWRLAAVEQALTGKPATPELWRSAAAPCSRRRKTLVRERVQGQS